MHLYDYLSLAYFEKNDLQRAENIVLKVLELNYFDGNTYVLLKKIRNQT